MLLKLTLWGYGLQSPLKNDNSPMAFLIQTNDGYKTGDAKMDPKTIEL